jgi:hypothetical protein
MSFVARKVPRVAAVAVAASLFVSAAPAVAKQSAATPVPTTTTTTTTVQSLLVPSFGGLQDVSTVNPYRGATS